MTTLAIIIPAFNEVRSIRAAIWSCYRAGFAPADVYICDNKEYVMSNIDVWELARETEDAFPSYPPGGRGRIPLRLMTKANNNIAKAFTLWWIEDHHRSMRALVNDLQVAK